MVVSCISFLSYYYFYTAQSIITGLVVECTLDPIRDIQIILDELIEKVREAYNSMLF